MNDADRFYLAIDRGPVPEQFAVLLVLGPGGDVGEAARVLGERAARIPRLRAEGRVFDPARHVYTRRCGRPGNERALLEVVLPEVTRWLRRDRPLWRAVFVTGLEQGRSALALIVHHALADGLGGLAILSALMDGAGSQGPAAEPAGFTAEPPARGRGAWASVAGGRRRWVGAKGGLFRGRAAACSLLAPTGSRRRALVVRTDLERLHHAARRNGATINAALLVAAAEALRRLLAHRGETLRAVRVGVPVGHARTGPGNAVGLLLVTVPVTGPRALRMARVAADTRAGRSRAPVTSMGRVFRLVAAAGGYRWYMNRQRRLHIVISCLRGPAGPVRLAGVPVERMIPIAPAGASNLTMAGQALSYAGTLTVTTVADPDRCPDLDLFGRFLRAELEAAAQ
ncbi:wax ester/triacylglycerol synthase domain-containing protein [Actinoplanes sp. CA-054009]